VLVDFYSTECPPCEAVAPKLGTLEKLFGKEIKFVKIYRQGNRELADQLGVKSSPTLLFYQDGEEVSARLTGGVKRSEIVRELKHVLGKERVSDIMKTQEPTITNVDVAILGAGPGGLTAGLYLCQARINTVLVDIALPGGNVSTTHMVSNYPGFIDPQPGYMLSHNMSEQTKRCGTTYKVAVDVTHVDLQKKEIVIDAQETIRAKRIIIATGTSPNRIGIPGELEFKGNGISYCATCDGDFFTDKEIVVVGGGNSALEEAVSLTKYASKVTIVHQFDHFQAFKYAVDEAQANPKISFVMSSSITAFFGNESLDSVEIKNLVTGEKTRFATNGVFIFIGYLPNTESVKDIVSLNERREIIVGPDMSTSVEGVYSAGDANAKRYRQVTTAVGDGTIAALAAADYLHSKKKKIEE